jgi:hypothetical protein
MVAIAISRASGPPVCQSFQKQFTSRMLVIRRLDDGKHSYTALLLPGEPARIFPSSDREHARILQIYKQDRAHPDIWNDFSEYRIGSDGPEMDV